MPSYTFKAGLCIGTTKKKIGGYVFLIEEL